MIINRQIFTSIQTVLRKRLSNVQANKTWTKLHVELSVGTRTGSKIFLSKKDRDLLRNFVINDTGIDPIGGEISGDRLALASKTANEKLSNQSVFGDEIKVFRNNFPLKLFGGEAETPPGGYISTTADNIDINIFDKIIVVENGAVFRNWSKAVVPDDLVESLVIYRGHDCGARVVQDLLQQRAARTLLYAAVDFDPEGFRIALNFKADAILIPEKYNKLRLEKNINKSLEFEKQNNKNCESLIPSGWKTVWDWLHDSRTAITQESLLVRRWPLIALNKGK